MAGEGRPSTSFSPAATKDVYGGAKPLPWRHWAAATGSWYEGHGEALIICCFAPTPGPLGAAHRICLRGPPASSMLKRWRMHHTKHAMRRWKSPRLACASDNEPRRNRFKVPR